MMPTLLPVLAAGSAAGLGLAIIVSELRPAPVRMDAALAQLSAQAPPPAASPGPGSALGRLAALLARRGGIAIPRTDLALLARTPEAFLLRKLTFALAGLMSFAAASAMLAVLGIQVPWAVPGGASL